MSSTAMSERPLLTLMNHHSAPGPELEDAASLYVGYFTNVHGEQLLFTCERGEAQATLYHGDNDWDASRVSEAPPGAVDPKLREVAGDADMPSEQTRKLATRFGISLYPFVSDI